MRNCFQAGSDLRLYVWLIMFEHMSTKIKLGLGVVETQVNKLEHTALEMKKRAKRKELR